MLATSGGRYRDGPRRHWEAPAAAAAAGSGSGGGGGGGGGGGEPGRRAAAPLLARGWPSDGATLGGTVADYAEMLDALDDALDVSSPLRADTPVYAGVRASPTA